MWEKNGQRPRVQEHLCTATSSTFTMDFHPRRHGRARVSAILAVARAVSCPTWSWSAGAPSGPFTMRTCSWRGKSTACLRSRKTGEFVMVDWKRTNPTPRRPGMAQELLGLDQKAFQNEPGNGPCASLPNTSFWHYVVAAARVYEDCGGVAHGMRISSSWLVQLHPALQDAHAVEVPQLVDDVVEEIFQLRAEEVCDCKRQKVTEASALEDGGGGALAVVGLGRMRRRVVSDGGVGLGCRVACRRRCVGHVAVDFERVRKRGFDLFPLG